MTMKQTGSNSIQDRQTPLERRLAVLVRHAPIGQCLTFAQFMELARRGRRASAYHTHMLHVVSCPACRRAYLNLRALMYLQRPSLARWLKRFSLPSMPQWALASGVAASVFALALWVLYPKSSTSNLVATRPESSSRVEVAQNLPADTNARSSLGTPSQGNRTGAPNSLSNQTGLSDKGGAAQGVSIDKGGAGSKRNNATSPPTNGKSSGIKLAQVPSTRVRQGSQQLPSTTSPDRQGDGNRTVLAQKPSNSLGEPALSKDPSDPAKPTLQQRLANAGELFRIPVSKLSEALASLTNNSTMRGGNTITSTGQVKFIEPDSSESRLLEEDRPLFKWEPVNNATKYAITLRAKSGEPTRVDELSSEQTSYRPPTPLERGKAYTLTLEVVREGLPTLSGTLRFEIMSADDLHDLRVARANVQKYPEASGIVLYRLQRYREALEAFEIAKQRNPQDPEIQRLVDRLRAQIR